MDELSGQVRAYRWVTFILAAGYTIYRLSSDDWSNPGGPLRFLTIWALLFSTLAAYRMLTRSLERTQRRYDVIAMTASVFNVMVVFLYWKLYFTDPALVNGDGPVVWHQEYYLHAVGPALQLIDALLIGRVFRRAWRGAIALMLLVPLYVLWAELFVQRWNDTPVGAVTTGLPYPFLNNMDFSARTSFYLLYGAVALGILTALTGGSWLAGRLNPSPNAARSKP